MSGRGILDADMHMLSRAFVQGWRWWIEELRGLVPAGLRSGGRDALPRFVVAGGRLLPESGGGRVLAVPRAGLRAALLVPASQCLLRVIERPLLSERDLQRMVAFEGDALLPFPPGTTIFASRVVTANGAGRMLAEVAGLPIETAREVALATAKAGVIPMRIEVQEDRATGRPLDFAPAMRVAGILTGRRTATPLIWSIVGFLAVLNLATLVWRDMASVGRLERMVAEQQPAVAVAQTMTRRIQRDQALAARSTALRSGHDALAGLAAVSRAMPEGAWLQRYVWDGPGVQLAGYRPAKTDVATMLRRSGRFAEVRSMTDEIQATVPAGDPFDLTARIIGR